MRRLGRGGLSSLGRGRFGLVCGGGGCAALRPGLATCAVGGAAPESGLCDYGVLLCEEDGVDCCVAGSEVVVAAAGEVGAAVGEGRRGGERESEEDDALVDGRHRYSYFKGGGINEGGRDKRANREREGRREERRV